MIWPHLLFIIFLTFNNKNTFPLNVACESGLNDCREGGNYRGSPLTCAVWNVTEIKPPTWLRFFFLSLTRLAGCITPDYTLLCVVTMSPLASSPVNLQVTAVYPELVIPAVHLLSVEFSAGGWGGKPSPFICLWRPAAHLAWITSSDLKDFTSQLAKS